MRLSYSSLSTYEKCPLQYKFQYVDRLPGQPSPALSFGDSLHQALYHFHNRPIPVAPKLDELHELLDLVWNPAGYKDSSEEASYFEHGHQVLDLYYAQNVDNFQIPVALEHFFRIDVDGVEFTGVIDRMDRLPGGGYEVIDYKTNRRLPPQARIDEDLQLSVYYLAAQQIWGIEPERMTLYYLLPGQRMSTTRTPADADELRRRIKVASDRIAAEMFEPHENPLCNWCDFQPRCPVFKHRYEDHNASPDAGMAEIVEEWIDLKRQARQVYSRLDVLNPQINAFADEHDYRRLFGADGAAVERRPQHITLPDVDALRAILEPLGLWHEVLSIDTDKLQDLIEARQLAPDVEEAVRAARRESETQHSLYLRELPKKKRPNTRA